jgi:hypothetical protein
MAGEICPYRQRQGSGDDCLPRPDPTNPEPGNSSHMPPHGDADTILPDPTLGEPARRLPDPTPSETPPHITGDSPQTSPFDPATPPRRTPPSNLNLEISTQRLDTHLSAPYPTPLREPVGLGIPHVVATTTATADPPHMSPRTLAEDTPPPNHSLTWRTHLSSPPNTREGPLLQTARPQHSIHGRQNSYRNNGSIPKAYISPATHA